MATLICSLETQHVVRDSEGSMLGTWRFLEPHTTHIRPFTWHTSWLPQRCRAGWQRQVRIDERFFNAVDESRIAALQAAPCGTIEVASN